MLEPTDPELGAALIEAARGPGFAAALLQAARGLDDVEEVFAYTVPDGGRPQAICASGGLCNSDECAEAYARSFYRHDPAMGLLNGTARRSGFAHRIAASSIRRQDYRALCFERARFVDKLCFGWRSETGALAVAFYRSRDGGQQLGRLAGLAELSLAALAARLREEARARATPVVERLEARLAGRFPALTVRERQVAARTLAGLNAEGIAASLGVGAASVLTYRQRGYARYGFNRAGDFLNGLVD